MKEIKFFLSLFVLVISLLTTINLSYATIDEEFQEIINFQDVIMLEFDGGKLYIMSLNEQYEDTSFQIKTALILQKSNLRGNISIFDKTNNLLTSNFYAGETNLNETYILGVWQDRIQENTTYTYELYLNNSLQIQGNFNISTLTNFIVNEVKTNIELKQTIENDQELILLLENKDILLSNKEYQNLKNLANQQFSLNKSITHITRTYANQSTINFTQTKIKLNNLTNLNSVILIETIPKEMAEKVNDISLNNLNYIILKDDPVIMWHLDNIENELIYEVKGEFQTTGRTTLLAETNLEKNNILKIILSLLLIPLIAIIIIYFSKFNINSKNT